ncbi:head GIN domain-containing protein [Maribacter sp. 2308TA10-17]|uniref:head GIN domain-containing protein n=1 Tax=Maribacter sp. 2308TA10-17 TaxID=3386276 RepID=UPI0039BCECB7
MMKNTITTLVLLLFTISAFGQKENVKQLEKFTQVKAYDRIVVKLIKSDENKIVITGDDQDEVSISNKNGLLKIRMEFDNFMDGDEAQATLYYTETLALIDANENARIKSDETVKGERVEIKAQEGGHIDLKIDIADLYTKSISGAEVTLTGEAKVQEVMVNTGGKIYNKKLNTSETTVVVNAGGRADVKASEKVKAKVRAGGSIYIYGNPKDVNRDKVFGGKIKIMD